MKFPKSGVWCEGDARHIANCYAYALNQPRLGKAVPGQLCETDPSGLRPEDYNEENFKALLEKDGLIEIKPPDTPDDYDCENYHMIAVVAGMKARDGRHPDFHFYRRDCDGSWSHKEGDEGAPSDIDDHGGPILDPQFIDRPKYEKF